MLLNPYLQRLDRDYGISLLKKRMYWVIVHTHKHTSARAERQSARMYWVIAPSFRHCGTSAPKLNSDLKPPNSDLKPPDPNLFKALPNPNASPQIVNRRKPPNPKPLQALPNNHP